MIVDELSISKTFTPDDEAFLKIYTGPHDISFESFNGLEIRLDPEKAERWKQISREAGELYFRKKREERWLYLDTRNVLRHTAFMRNMRMMIRGWCENEFKKG